MLLNGCANLVKIKRDEFKNKDHHYGLKLLYDARAMKFCVIKISTSHNHGFENEE